MPITITPTIARRLAITRQRLAGPRPKPNAAGIMEVARDLRCLQLDPISAVARSHLLVLWSRLGRYDPAHLDTLLWKDRSLFEYWAHCASIVLTEDYPLHQALMRSYDPDGDPSRERAREWLRQNAATVTHILSELHARGPLGSQHFARAERTAEWYSSGWTSERTINRIFDFLWFQGRIMVAGRESGHRLWALAERHLPHCIARDPLPACEVTRRAAQHSLRALGVARPAHIRKHFVRDRYPDLNAALADLDAEGRIARIEIAEDGRSWNGPWYVHADDLPLLERLLAGEWMPRTTLLSPFDNLICDRARTEEMFGFDFRIEIYVPKEKRQFGYYVLPILHGDRLIGRIDPIFDRKQQRLVVNAVYAEPDAPMTKSTARSVGKAVQGLADFVGARTIDYIGAVPDKWRSGLEV